MAKNDSDMLFEAIERNAAAVLSLPSAGMVRYHKTRFLRAIDDRVWIESVPSERPLIKSLIEDGQEVSVHFKVGSRKAGFASAIHALDVQYRFLKTAEMLEAIQLYRPPVVKPVQRRSYYRAPVHAADKLKIELWRITEEAALEDQPTPMTRLKATVRDLSVGGVGVIFLETPLLTEGQRLRILLCKADGEPMLIEGRSRSLEQNEQSKKFEAGIRFHDLQGSLRGRRQLNHITRIVAALELNEARRLRGMAG
jgi:c-di-GMP-binding flagellar brake protein YcgR